MTEATLTPDRILDAAEDCLRRFGPQKTTVVDVARALDVSHGAIYRHYASKEALREAVVRRWLERSGAPLQAIAESAAEPVGRLCRWLDHMILTKREVATCDPEMFNTYRALVKDMGDVRSMIQAHLSGLQAQLARMIAEGVEQGRFDVPDPLAAARAVFNATVSFHHPMLIKESINPDTMDTEYEEVLHLILAGLGLRPPVRP